MADMLTVLDPPDVLHTVRGEYDELPGLCLTRTQFARLFNLEAADADWIIGRLVADGFLRVDRLGRLWRGADRRP